MAIYSSSQPPQGTPTAIFLEELSALSEIETQEISALGTTCTCSCSFDDQNGNRVTLSGEGWQMNLFTDSRAEAIQNCKEALQGNAEYQAASRHWQNYCATDTNTEVYVNGQPTGVYGSFQSSCNSAT